MRQYYFVCDSNVIQVPGDDLVTCIPANPQSTCDFDSLPRQLPASELRVGDIIHTQKQLLYRIQKIYWSEIPSRMPVQPTEVTVFDVILATDIL